ncbi:hypothetical protein D3C81_1437160 [compost metagenome]
MPDRTGQQEVDRNRHPDQGGTNRRQQREKGHQYAPQQSALNAEEPERDAAECALYCGDDDIAFDGGADRGGQVIEQRAFVIRIQGCCLANAGRDFVAVAQQEKQHVQHDGEADQEVEGVLPDADRLLGNEFAALYSSSRQLGLQARDIGQAETIHLVDDPGWQRRHDFFKVHGEIDLAGADIAVKIRCFMYQRNRNQHQRQDDHHQANPQGGECGQVAALVHFDLQLAVKRRKQDGEDCSPEHCAIERQQDPDEGNREGDQ